MTNVRSEARARNLALRPSLAFLIFGSLVALACGDSNDDDDKGAGNTNTPGAMGGTTSMGGNGANPGSSGADAGTAPLGGLGGLTGIFGDAGFDPSTFDPNTICSTNPEYCKDGSVDIQGGIDGIANAACMFNASLCSDSGAGFLGGLAGGLGGLFGGGRDAGAGAGGTGTQTGDAGSSGQSDAGSSQSGDAGSSDAGAASDSGSQGDAQ